MRRSDGPEGARSARLHARRYGHAVAGTIARLIGVYDADGTVLGEISYFVKARLGQAHCALCDITHGLVRERTDWRAARDGLPVEFVTFHRDDQPEPVRAVSAGRLPAVIAELGDGGHVVLLDGDELESCAGDPASLVARLRAVVDDRGLDLGA
jgi:hypothetical protein